MRPLLAMLLAVLLVSPDLAARDIHDWNNVRKLKHGTTVVVDLTNGDEYWGRIESVQENSLTLAVPDHTVAQASWVHTLDRAAIRQVVRSRGPVYLPDPRRWMIVGAVAGGAAGVTTGAIEDTQKRNQGRWLLGGVFGSMLGAMGGLVTAGCIAVVQLPRGMAQRDKVVYEAVTH